jgi:hypothetical protein
MWTLLPLEHREDLETLRTENHDVYDRVLHHLAHLRSHPDMGEPMKPLRAHQVHSRSLEDCHVIRVGTSYTDSETRIVYRTDEVLKTIEIVAIGPRRNSQVYRMAMDRLRAAERPEPPRWAKYAKGRVQRDKG